MIARLFLPAFGNDVLAALEDQAIVGLPSHNGTRSPRIAITTDSFVVRPLFFPGGDIGKLAVHGTVNDLAVGGATPLYLTAAFILEEGLPIADLERIVASMRQACAEAGVALVTGDTKVVDRGKGDGVFITTTGVGLVPEGRSLSISAARPGDRIVVSGTIGDHGIAIMSVREGIEFETVLESDTAPLERPGPGDARGLSGHPRDARPDPRRRVEHLERAGRRVASRRHAQRGGDPGPRRGPGRLRDAGARPALRRQRRKADRRRSARGRRPAGGGHASPSAGTERRDHRRGRGRASGHGHHALAGRRRARGRRCFRESNCRGSAERET